MEKIENSSQQSAPLSVELLGEFLKNKRIEKGYTLEKMSQKTKISVNILKALETNEFNLLPSAAYIKGFVISYVKVLGLTQDEAINKMEYTYLNVLGRPFPALNHTKNMPQPAPQLKSSDPKSEKQTPHEVIENGDSIIESTKSLLPVIILSSIILVFVGVYQLISSVVDSEINSDKRKNLGPKIESSSALVKNKETSPATNETQKTSDDTIAESSKVNSDKLPNEPAPLNKENVEIPRNFPTINFKKIEEKLFMVKSDAPENEDETIFPKNIRDSINPEAQNLYIKAVSGNTWLSYKIDSRPIESVVITKGNDLFIQGTELRVFLGNVNVTKIFYNNYLIETPTKSGVKSLVFPEENNSKYQLPLFPKAKDDILYTAEEYQKRMKLEEDELGKKKD